MFGTNSNAASQSPYPHNGARLEVSDTPTVYVIDDDANARNALAWLLESISLKVQTFESAKQCIDHLNSSTVGCIISDVRMPELSGLELHKQLREHDIFIPVILLTGFADIPMAVSALKEGVYDFLEKPYHDQSILDAVQAALSSNELQQKNFRQVDSYRKRLASLTGREHQVVELIVDGKSNNDAANILSIGIRAIETYRSNAMKKMQARSLANLVYMCARASDDEMLPGKALAS